jgi:hypothetical protein
VKDFHALIGTGILLLTTWGAMAVAWGSLGERVETLTALDVEKKERIQKCEERLRVIENDRGIENQLSTINGRLVAIEVKVDGLGGSKRR